LIISSLLLLLVAEVLFAGILIVTPFSALAQQQLSPEEIQNEILRGGIQIERNDNDATTTGSSVQSVSNGSILVYKNPVYEIRTQYPDGWEILIESTSNSSLSLRFNSPLENDTDIFRENVVFVVDTISNNTDLGNYTSAALTSYLKRYPDIKFDELSSTNLTNNTIPAYRFVASRAQDDLELMQIFAVEEDKLFSILYSAEKTRYSTYLPIVEKMINSFEVT
jgi:PsbP-like protein